MDLNPGDSFYYEPHMALGVLVERFQADGQVYWSYALRSPTPGTLKEVEKKIVVSLRQAEEHKLIQCHLEGHLVYYESR